MKIASSFRPAQRRRDVNRQRAFRSGRLRREQLPNAGFTLVELLVVIVIIGLLVAILIPAVMGAMASARRARVAAEVANLDAGIEALRTNKNLPTYPPGFSTGLPGDATTNSYKEQQFAQFMGQMFRYRDAQGDRPFNASRKGMPVPVNFADLDCAEALVLWLRGATDNQQYPLCGRLNNNPSQPVVLWVDPTSENAAVVEVPSYNSTFDFDPTRLGDRDQDGFPEYYPPNGGEKVPYVYIPSTEYQRIYASGQPPYVHLTVNAAPVPASPAPFPYLANVPAGANNIGVVVQNLQNFAAAQKFQIIAPGLDGMYSTQGRELEQINPSTFLLYKFADGPYSDAAQKDNITNFAGGTLESKMP